MAKSKYVKDIDRGWLDIKENLRRGDGVEIAVGIPEEAKARDGTTVAIYAADNEFGTNKIPSRPFMRTAFDENKAKYVRMMNTIWRAVTSPNGNVINSMERLGSIASKDIQNTISGRDFLPKLSEQTIKAKKGSTKTLIDESAMINAVNFTIRRTKGSGLYK